MGAIELRVYRHGEESNHWTLVAYGSPAEAEFYTQNGYVAVLADTMADQFAFGSHEAQFTILVAASDQVLLSSLTKTLSTRRFRLVTAQNSREAQQRALETRLDAVVIDHHLGGASALALLGKMKAAQQQIPCLILADHSCLGLVVEALKDGVFGCGPRPESSPKLIHGSGLGRPPFEPKITMENSRPSGCLAPGMHGVL